MNKTPYEILKNVNNYIFFILIIFGGLSMLSLFTLGFWEIGKGICTFFGVISCANSEIKTDSLALETCIKGLEFIFLAPLIFFLLIGLAKYTFLITPSPEKNEHEIALARKNELYIRSELMVVKAFIASLFIAVFFASLIGRALSSSGLTYEVSISSTLIIIVLIIYFYFLEKSATDLKNHYFNDLKDHDEKK